MESASSLSILGRKVRGTSHLFLAIARSELDFASRSHSSPSIQPVNTSKRLVSSYRSARWADLPCWTGFVEPVRAASSIVRPFIAATLAPKCLARVQVVIPNREVGMGCSGQHCSSVSPRPTIGLGDWVVWED